MACSVCFLEDHNAITEQFVAACCSAAQLLHTEGLVSRALSSEVPVLVHELEYYDAIADQNEHCNPSGIAEEFVLWVRSGVAAVIADHHSSLPASWPA